MRLWHQTLIPYLPRAQLLGQHRECAALRGAGWGRPHATVDYVFRHPPHLLYRYHLLVMAEMRARGYRPAEVWNDPAYRGQKLPPHDKLAPAADTCPLYPEHDAPTCANAWTIWPPKASALFWNRLKQFSGSLKSRLPLSGCPGGA